MEVGNLTVPVSADLGPIQQQLNELKRLLGQTENQTNGVTNAMRGVTRQTNGLTAALRPLAVSLAGIFAAKNLIQFTDIWTDLTSRVNLAAGSIEKGSAVMDQLQVIARRTYSSLEQTTEGYIRNAQTLRDLGRSTQDTLDYTEALNNALVVSGARADRAARVQEALGRGLAAGALRGQELNTVIETGGRVAELLAEELGTTVSGLRKFGSEGKITGDVIDRALVGNLEKLREEAESMPATIGDAFTLIGNTLLSTIGTINEAVGSSEGLAASLIGVADAISDFTPTLVQAATFIQNVFSAALEKSSGILNFFGELFDSTSAKIIAGGAAAAVAVTALAGIISGALVGALQLLAATILANPFTLFVAAIGAAIAATYVFRDEIAEIIGVDLFKIIYDGTNDLIGQFKGAYDAVVAVWDHLPNAFGSIGKLAFNALLDGLSGEVLAFTNPFTGERSSFGIDLSGFKSDLNEIESHVEAAASAAYRAAQGVDYIAEGSDRVRDAWRDASGALKTLDDLTKDGGPNRVVTDAGGAERLKEAYQDLIRDSQAFIAQQEIERQAIGMTELEAAKLRATFDLLNQAQRAGIELTPQQTEELKALAAQMAEAEYAVSRLREQYDFAKDTFKGFFTDLKTGLQNGASLWEAFGNAAANALQKIADKALDLALNGIFDMIFNAFTSGIGGGLGALVGGGLYENGTSYARGGWSVVGERGPELLKLPGGSQVIPNNRVTAPQQASFGGGSAAASESRVAIDIFVRDDGKIGAIARQEAGAIVGVAIHDYDTSVLPDSVQRISNQPRIR